jgi:hypothetical protein
MALYKVLEVCFIGDRLYKEGDIADVAKSFGPDKSPCLVACDEAGEPLVAKATRKGAETTPPAAPADLG